MPPASAYASDVMTVPASLAGLPAISISAGLDAASGAPRLPGAAAPFLTPPQACLLDCSSSLLADMRVRCFMALCVVVRLRHPCQARSCSALPSWSTASD